MLKNLEQKALESTISKKQIKQLRGKFYSSLKVQQQQVLDLWPIKGKAVSFKLKSGDGHKSEHIIIDKEIHFVQTGDQNGDYVVPPLKIVHNFPDIYPKWTVDEGALKFVMKGANIMAPGLINEHSSMDQVEAGTIVGIYVYGHEHALAIGVTTMSSAQVKETKQGVAINTIHFIGDAFWNLLYKQ